VKDVFEKGIEHEDTIATLNASTTHFLQITKVSDFSLSKVQDSPWGMLFCEHVIVGMRKNNISKYIPSMS
jgi:hypothetical protein